MKMNERWEALKEEKPMQRLKACLLYTSIYGTMYLSSPAMAGCLKPCIYLPIRLVSDCDLGELRYMLLHELQHYRCQDAWAGCAMDLARILYWFHPLVWYALGNMKQDRELACDTAVLQMLEQKNYHDYGLTLIHFAGQISGTPFSCTSGIGLSLIHI